MPDALSPYKATTWRRSTECKCKYHIAGKLCTELHVRIVGLTSNIMGNIYIVVYYSLQYLHSNITVFNIYIVVYYGLQYLHSNITVFNIYIVVYYSLFNCLL